MSDLIAKHLATLRVTASPRTVHDRQAVLDRLDRTLPHGLDEALPEELEAWLGNQDWCTKTRETYWCHIVGFYRWAVRGRSPKLDWDPSEELARPKPRKRLPHVAADAQLRHCLDALGHPARRCVILAAGAGMRASEIADSDREDYTRRQVIILGKGDKQRAVPLTADVWEEVRDLPPGPVVTDRHGQRVDGHWITRHCSAALDAIGENNLTIHWFRGSFATRLRRSGADAFVIARLLGHSSLGPTQRYIEVDDDDLTDAIASLPDLDKPARKSAGAPARV
jgi:integrase/recombinase XerC